MIANYKQQRQNTRRQFITDAVRGVCTMAVTGIGLSAYSAKSGLDIRALRPPGALDGDDFLAACVRCGLCVQACPYDTLKLATLFEPVTTGTPHFIARQVACEMCEDIPCQAACPTGAISPTLKSIDDAQMGLAVIVDQENCLNFQGLRCDVCHRVCPLMGEAITLEIQRNTRTGHHAMFIPTVHSDSCTGCGKCEQACPLETEAIKVLPRSLARGELGEHYRWGWVEKQKHGKSLIGEVLELPHGLPTGDTK